MTDTVTNSAGSSKDNSTPLAKFLARFFKQKAAPTGSYYGEPGRWRQPCYRSGYGC